MSAPRSDQDKLEEVRDILQGIARDLNIDPEDAGVEPGMRPVDAALLFARAIRREGPIYGGMEIAQVRDEAIASARRKIGDGFVRFFENGGAV